MFPILLSMFAVREHGVVGDMRDAWSSARVRKNVSLIRTYHGFKGDKQGAVEFLKLIFRELCLCWDRQTQDLHIGWILFRGRSLAPVSCEVVNDNIDGLKYLHHSCKPPIIHRDIKTTNILLNNEMQAKLADFGLSKAFPSDGGPVTTAFTGTPGYFHLEFNMNETIDVYSFGVVLLEVLPGKPPIAQVKERTHISKWVGQALETNGDVREVVDRRLGNDFDSNSAWKLVDVAMVCAAPASVGRPTMNQVVIELKRCLEMEKARLEKDSQNETNYESVEYNSNLNIEMPGMSPAAR